MNEVSIHGYYIYLAVNKIKKTEDRGRLDPTEAK